MATAARELAIVTGASSGIGLELARCAVGRGIDLIIAADDPAIHDVANDLRAGGCGIQAVEGDLATLGGVDRLYDALKGHPCDILCANAGHGLGGAFLDQDFATARHVIDTNITGTIYLIQKVARDMRARRKGHILITGSIAGFMPGTFLAVYNASKAFIDSFAFALRAELDGSGVGVTCLMPGPTETGFFARADMLDTKVGQQKKDDPAEVARLGFEAMLRGDGDIVSGWKNKLQTVLAQITPAGTLAEQHRRMAAPGSGRTAH